MQVSWDLYSSCAVRRPLIHWVPLTGPAGPVMTLTMVVVVAMMTMVWSNANLPMDGAASVAVRRLVDQVVADLQFDVTPVTTRPTMSPGQYHNQDDERD